MIHLKSITIKKKLANSPNTFPFNVPSIRSADKIEFTAPVTFLVGENGSGKSTFLEALACAIGSITVGSENVKQDKTLINVKKLARLFKLYLYKRTLTGFFLRAEDFFGYAKRLSQIRAELEDELKQIDQRYQGRSQKAKELAKMPYLRELHDMQQR